MDIHAVVRVFQDRFRPRRMRKMAVRSGITSSTTVLDVGGTELNWEYCPIRPKLVILNIEPLPDATIAPQVVADGCRLPFPDDAFDFVFSNSVIEHVGDQRTFAQEIARVGKSFYVQTPNRQFPIETHLIAPIIHWLPIPWQKRLIRYFTPWGLITKPSGQEVDDFLTTTHLLDANDMELFFPGTDLEKEQFLGLTKSLVVWGQ
jgi:SAM-dependent methyltransferase